jgi:hypothetical protein
MAIRFKFWNNMQENAYAYVEYWNYENGYWYALYPNALSLNNNVFNQPDYYVYDTLFNGNAWTGHTEGWNTYTYYLDQRNQDIRFRIHFKNKGAGTSQGFAIDDFEVFYQPQTDLKINKVWPVTSPWLTSTNSIGAQIYNYGSTTEDGGTIVISGDFDDTYSFNSIDPLSYTDVTIPNGYDFSSVGTKYTVIYDIDNESTKEVKDSHVESVTKLATINSFPYFTSFESADANDTTWYTYNKVFKKKSEFSIGSPTGTMLNNAYQGVNAISTADGKQMAFNGVSYIESPDSIFRK